MKVVESIRALSSSINNYNESSPHVLCYEILEMESEHADPLSRKAAARWKAIYDKNPEDPVAAHHLAVICHGLAYQLHAGNVNEQNEAIDYWGRSLKVWSKVIHSDSFWEYLIDLWQTRAEKGKGDLLAERLLKVDLKSVRKRLPQYLLDTHKNIVQNLFKEQPEIAARHLELIRKSPFGVEYRNRATESLYQSTAGGLVDTCIREHRSEEGLTAIRNYLQMDPNHSRALCDALKLCEVHAEHLKSRDMPYLTRRRAFTEGLEWAQKLESIANSTGDLFQIDSLRLYYREFATLIFLEGVDLANKKQLMASTDYFFEAVDPALKSMKLEKGGQDSRRLYVNVINHVGLLATLTQQKIEQAISILKSGIASCPDNPLLHARLANLAAFTRDENLFNSELREAERCQSGNPDSIAAQLLADLRQAGMGIAVIPLLNEAGIAMEANDFYTAKSKLRQAIKLDSENPLSLVLLAICHSNQQEILDFKTVFSQARSAQRKRKDPQAGEIIANLERQLRAAGVSF